MGRRLSERTARAVVTADGIVESEGDLDRITPVASVTKALVAHAMLVAVEEGTLDLDAPAGPEGSTVRHLLAHASGLPFEGTTPIAAPGRRRIYSNAGFDALGEHFTATTRLTIPTYLHEALLTPLGMVSTVLEPDGSPAKDARSSVGDLARFAAELLAPTLVSPVTLADATRPQLGTLPGRVPGIARYDDNAWGLGFELHTTKAPHWMPANASPGCFGHFGATGSFVWVDPEAGVATAYDAGRAFGPWALDEWPDMGRRVLSTHGQQQ